MENRAEKEDTILNLFDRPNEPIFLPKGDKGVVFNVPSDYLEDRFKGESDLANRFGGDKIQVKQITIPLQGLELPKRLGKDELFSFFIPYHRQMAAALIELFMRMQSYEDFISLWVYCRGIQINPAMLNYAVSVALLNRPDTKNIDIPPLSDYFPSKFVDGQTMRRAREEAKLNVDATVPLMPLEIPMDYTASDLDEEHRVAYFREDLGVNLHHWHWHLVYPFLGPREVISKDRRGELFYYMHEQLIARYNFERYSNKLGRVARLLDLRAPIENGYFPKLDSVSASRNWASRAPNTILRDVNRPAEQIKFDILDLERWRDRLYEAAQSGRIIDSNGNVIQLTEETGIDILGNLIEASDISPNKNIYGDLHNLGHVAIAYSHDPDHRHLETFSVMGDATTAMRDPIFYRWHAFIDDIFQDYKSTLPAYTGPRLLFDRIQVTGLSVQSQGAPPNTFNTFWQKSSVNLSRGMDFQPRAPVLAQFTHLQHAPFEYRITVNNRGNARQGTVRIFMAPKFDERGQEFLYNDQRLFMIELDKFVFNLPSGETTITRSSTESSVTIPFDRTFRNLETTSTGSRLEEFNFCGCGWPQHMLIPKGTAEGLDAVLFVMISNFEQDRVDNQGSPRGACDKAISYCGRRDAKYPDRQPMGFPFDRNAPTVISTLQQFLTQNMRSQDVKIVFVNRLAPEDRRQGLVSQPTQGQGGRPNQGPGGRPQQGGRPNQGQNRPKSPGGRN